jgi:two-component system, OmpR family, phosphate regulon response regulator PhoB
MALLILIIEDEQDLATTLVYNLEREGFATRCAHSGTQALEAAGVDPSPDLILLDLMLPDMSGTDVCRKLRSMEATRAVPIIMLTARGEESDRVKGFEVGADDYVVKPFSVRELLLRVKAILRRAQADESSARSASVDPIDFAALRIDIPAHRVYVGGDEVKLTALEFKLLLTLFERRGQALSRETLLSDVWDIQADVMTRTVDTHIKRLREKIGAAGDYIETLRGVGYRFIADPPQ